MRADDRFAQWAAAFLRSVGKGADGAAAGAAHSGPRYEGVTPAAGELLRTVDAGGVPAFVTANLRQVAGENGIVVDPAWTPNRIIDALRAKVRVGDPGSPAPEP